MKPHIQTGLCITPFVDQQMHVTPYITNVEVILSSRTSLSHNTIVESGILHRYFIACTSLQDEDFQCTKSLGPPRNILHRN